MGNAESHSNQVAPEDAEMGDAANGGAAATSSLAAGVSGRMSSVMQSVTDPFAPSVQVENDIDLCACLPALTRQQRLVGFLACFTFGTALSIMSSFLVLNPVKVRARRGAPALPLTPPQFALPYTLGNVIAMMSTSFVVGPKTQCRYACDPVRRASFAIFIGALLATLISALVLKKGLLTLLFLIVQVCASLWYTASYVPFGQRMLMGCVNSMLGKASSAVASG